ncbi:uncharacterized protein LOC113514938 [Galleria mellonella]|uniref:Uncharacterized protein LOC113514938 n=1 Tax=Galleria mellonella TaxID=7137 RepID=A0ABM3MQC7_GALME|nr:uncharacterized protein LOC113514938 [Galleria mellonella]
MARHYCIGFVILFAFFLQDVASRPSNNELINPFISEKSTESLELRNNVDKEDKSLSYNMQEGEESDTKDILDKIKIVNAGLKKPNRRQQINVNGGDPQIEGYVLDKDILEKLQQIIASGKLKPLTEVQKYQENNLINNEDTQRNSYSKSLPYLSKSMSNNQVIPALPIPYITNIPVLVMPSLNNIYNAHGSVIPTDLNSQYQTRQQSPFPFQWPLAPYFPILIKDPLLNVLQGGGWNNLFEYGQNADICNRKQKSTEDKEDEESFTNDINTETNKNYLDQLSSNLRQGRAIKKRTVNTATQSKIDENLNTLKKVKKFFSQKPSTNTQKPVKQQEQSIVDEPSQGTKTNNFLDDGDLRFGQFSWFGDKKPIAPSPGFFINRLKVRRGGVAIAGPGGVATAGRGGAAIVGPGGLAYTQPGGLAVAGPAARVVALSPDANFSSIISRLQEVSSNNDQRENQIHGFSKRSDDYQYNGSKFVKSPLKAQDSKLTLIVKPIARAIGGVKGIAIANPISKVVIAQNKLGSIIHAPIATAIAGPGGIAHAQSDLESVQYLPFYGGAKGQYLEIKRDTSGRIISESIVSEDKISTDSIVKNNDETLVSKVLAANLQNLKMLSASVMKLHNLGRRTGSLGRSDKERFKTQLEKLAEAASNTIKLIDEVGDNIDMLFKSNATQRRVEYDEDDVGEEGVGIDAPTDNDPEEILGGATIAEAKPVGLAIIGENGLAASRPIGTAVAASGVALARPIATAVAGLDPTMLGINFQINHSKN